MTPLHLQQITEFTGIDITPCISPLDTFTAYIYSKKVYFHTHHLYVTERGPQKTSLDYYLYQKALNEGVTFEFSQPLTPETLHTIPHNSIIATGTYSGLCKYLKLRHTPFVHFNSHLPTHNNNNFCIAYFDTYIAGYGYGYLAGNNNITSVEVDFPYTAPHEKLLHRFSIHLKKTENLTFTTWSMVADNIPEKPYLLKTIQGKTCILAGAISGFHDPFFGFGVNSALVSGKIAALMIDSKKKCIQEYNRFTTKLARMFLLSKIYHAIPLKNIIIPRFFTPTTTHIPLIGSNLQSIPGFTHEDCFKIAKIQSPTKKK